MKPTFEIISLIFHLKPMANCDLIFTTELDHICSHTKVLCISLIVKDVKKLFSLFIFPMPEAHYTEYYFTFRGLNNRVLYYSYCCKNILNI